MTSDILNSIIEYLKTVAKPYGENIFLLNTDFIRVSECSKYIYIEYADNKEMAEMGVFGDENCYDKSIGINAVLSDIKNDLTG